MPSMFTFLAKESGAGTQGIIDYYAERAKGGAGPTTIESAYVLEESRVFGRLGIENPPFKIGLSELAESIQEHGAKAFLQINHCGSALRIQKGNGPDGTGAGESGSIVEAFGEGDLQRRKPGLTGWKSTERMFI